MLWVGGIKNTVAGHGSVSIVIVNDIESRHPLVGQVVFPGSINEQGMARVGVPTKTCCSAVDANVMHIHQGGKSVHDIETHAQNAAVRHPEVSLCVKRNAGCVGTAAEAVAWPVAQAVVLSYWKRLLNLD